MPVCGAPTSTASAGSGDTCQHPVKVEGMRCHQHRADVPTLEEAPELATRRVAR